MRAKAFSYLRVSGEGPVGRGGFGRQEDAIAKYAEANRLEIVREFRDEGDRGTIETLDRPGLTGLFAAVKSNRVRVVVVENAIRIARDLVTSEFILAEFRKLGVKVIAANGGVELTFGKDDPAGKLVRQILEAVSEWEKCPLVQRLRGSRMRTRRAGQRCEGRQACARTSGKQPVIQDMRGWPEGAKSCAEVAEALKTENLSMSTRPATKWQPSQVQRGPARASGSAMFSPEAWQQIARHLRLSGRELEIVRGTFDDRTESAIAADLQISTSTVHTHIERLHHKLAVTDRAQLLLHVVREFVALPGAPGIRVPPMAGS